MTTLLLGLVLACGEKDQEDTAIETPVPVEDTAVEGEDTAESEDTAVEGEDTAESQDTAE